MPRIVVVGGGLAGSEASLQLAKRGWDVELHEMRPVRKTPAHQGEGLAEMVCSNTFKSEREDTPSGTFKLELEMLGSELLPLAKQCRVPGGHALALDRELFSATVTAAIEANPRIRVIRGEVVEPPADVPVLLATGPLTSPDLETWLREQTGDEGFYFYDAIAPSVLQESIDETIAWKASRYDKGDADYWNCPFDKEQYEAFIDALLAAERVPMKDFEKAAYFPGCMPIEAIAEKGRESLRFGPFRPVGLEHPQTGKRAWAVLQLRQETRDGTLFGLVGCQTQLRYGEQSRIFSMVPGLQNAEFARLGSLHRNTYIDARKHLAPDLSLRGREQTWLAGQMIGVEGYVESLAMGLMAALSIDARHHGRTFTPPPVETITGSLMAYLREGPGKKLSPMNVNFGLLPPIPNAPRDKKARKLLHSQRALQAMREWAGAREAAGA